MIKINSENISKILDIMEEAFYEECLELDDNEIIDLLMSKSRNYYLENGIVLGTINGQYCLFSIYDPKDIVLMMALKIRSVDTIRDYVYKFIDEYYYWEGLKKEISDRYDSISEFISIYEDEEDSEIINSIDFDNFSRDWDYYYSNALINF